MKQELKSERSKQIIADVAFTLFYEHGFKSTSIDKIMNATPLTKGAFYHHYKNKQELGLEIIGLKLERAVVKNMIEPLKAPGNALQILENTFLNRLKSFSFYDKQHGCPMNNFINEIGDYEITYQSALKNIIEKWKAALVDLLERGKNDNCIRKNLSSEAVAIYLISAFEGIRGIRKLYNDDVILDDYIAGLSIYLKQLTA